MGRNPAFQEKRFQVRFSLGVGFGAASARIMILPGSRGLPITVERLSEIFLELQEKGAANINLVTGAHYVPQIVQALDMAGEKGMDLPVVYNSSGYEKLETLKFLEGYVDVYLPDMKYMESELAQKFSHAADYPETAKAAIGEMVRQTGKCEFRMRMAISEREP